MLLLQFATARRKLGKSLRLRGLGGTIALIPRFLAERLRALSPRRRQARALGVAFDRAHGVDTSGQVDLERFHIDNPNWVHGVRYEATPPEVFGAMLRGLALPYQEFAFIDLGAGKGRTVLLASTYPFRKIIGVELVPELHAVLMANIQSYRRPEQRCLAIEAVLGDAAAFEFPPLPSLVYLYNPFTTEVLRPVLDNLRGSLARYPRQVFLGYYTPKHASVIDAAAFLERVITSDEFVIWGSRAPGKAASEP